MINLLKMFGFGRPRVKNIRWEINEEIGRIISKKRETETTLWEEVVNKAGFDEVVRRLIEKNITYAGNFDIFDAAMEIINKDKYNQQPVE